MRCPARLAGIVGLLLVGAAAGLAAVRFGLAIPLGALAGLALFLIAFFEPKTGLLCALGIATLLPFGVLPFRLAVTPSFLEIVLLGLLAGWLLAPWLREGRRYRLAPLDLGAWLFMGLLIVGLSLGIGRGLDATRVHNVGKFLLALLAYFGARQTVKDGRHVRQYLAVLLVCAGLAAALGILLHALPDPMAQAVLTRLGVVGYPTTGRVLRYVEDDPHGLERAIGTSVDPNAFGGMLAFAASVALGELLQPRGHALPRYALGLILATLLGAIYLTYSRAALGGWVAGCLFLAAARYRRLFGVLLAGALILALLVAGLWWNTPVVERFREGVRFQDLANRMRLAEYANAWAILRRYPIFGVGLAGAPDIDLSTGVSSLYLTIAEHMGLVGLAAFLGLVGAALAQGLYASRNHTRATGSGHRLALLSGVVTALAIGLLDHYFFNVEFPHMALMFWSAVEIASDRGWDLP